MRTLRLLMISAGLACDTNGQRHCGGRHDALLSGYLPERCRARSDRALGARGFDAALSDVLAPPAVAACTLVILNGSFVRVADRSTRNLVQGDVLAIWPPGAGG